MEYLNIETGGSQGRIEYRELKRLILRFVFNFELITKTRLHVECKYKVSYIRLKNSMDYFRLARS